jgi:hypothetical protein
MTPLFVNREQLHVLQSAWMLGILGAFFTREFATVDGFRIKGNYDQIPCLAYMKGGLDQEEEKEKRLSERDMNQCPVGMGD